MTSLESSTDFLYRVPNSEEVVHVSGYLSETCDSDETIVIQPFSGKKLFLVPINELIKDTESRTYGIEGKTTTPITNTKETYLSRFEAFHTALKAGTYKKLILSRVGEEKTKKSPLELFKALNAKYTNTFNYLLVSAEHGVWLGATPERLGVVEGNTLFTEAVAGTKPINSERDWTSKERHEHQLVIDFIEESLKANGCGVRVEETQDLEAGMVKHLHTKIQAEIGNNKPEDLIDALHPTSATCGIPQRAAQEFIIENEAHDRELYTGYIGVLKKDSQKYFVNLRCMQVQGESAYLYLGGGLTVDSEGELEWNETCEKAKTLLSVL